jgi:hypothetical protein
VTGAKLSVGLLSVLVTTDAREPDMIVDCDRCEVRGNACGDCVVTVLLGSAPGGVRFDATEQRAIDALAGAGLIPRLRLVDADRSTGRRDVSIETARDTSGVARDVAKRGRGGAERSSREAG